MRLYRSLPALAFAALVGFSANGVQAGRFFGRGSDGSDNTYQYSNRSQDSFGFGPAPQYPTPQPYARHRLFHREQGVANGGMPANAMPGYGMPPAYGSQFGYMQTPMAQSPFNGMPANAVPGYGLTPAYGTPYGYTQAPIVQSPIPTPPFQTTSIAPAPAPVARAVQSPSCRTCGQSAQTPISVPSAPVMQSRLVPIPTPMPQGPTTAEPPRADLTGRAPF